ncbi:MAG: gamma carbonic anhydrase family protein [Cytophagales bacterium]|nr:gamma carbonic anhydrase family protein [Cytophagales bacterium]
MALIKSVRGKTPQFGERAYLSENATVIGDVTMGDDCTIWFTAVVRGDVNSIVCGNKVNIQDGAIVHCTYEKASTTIGNNVSVGHRAMVHGCTIQDNVLVGMGAIIMDNAIIGENSIIAAGAIVLENTVVEPNSIYAGIPAKKVKDLDSEKAKQTIERTANNYVKYASWYSDEEE